MTVPAAITRFDGAHRFLSNFALIEVPIFCHLEGREIVFPSGEHAFNFAKSENLAERAWVLAASTPGQAKKRGQKVTLRPGWDDTVRYTAMEYVQLRKFSPGRDVTQRLVATGDAMLVEGNKWHDGHWGVCICSEEWCIEKRKDLAERGQPSNVLGQILMTLRAAYRKDGGP